MERMEANLSHRGPDDRGVFIDPRVCLGHRRLSIIDLVSGHQPMFSTDKKQIIVYNGEIYNFQEVKRELETIGHSFSTNSDTEVLLNAYRQWGYECLDKLNGIFAFALWDNTTNKLWLARDRIGKKPLYYLKDANGFYFASEAKALWNLPHFAKRYDHDALDHYLTFRYIPNEKTFYKGILQIPAGHWMLVDTDAHLDGPRQWWDIPRARKENNRKKDINEYCEEFYALFSSAVKLRLISDVPLGLFLSSGIDSSSIAIEMAKTAPPTCVSIGFGEETDELNATGLLAKKINARYHPFIMKESDFDSFAHAIASMDEPYGDPIILPTYLLAKRASEKVKVILTGDGADEVLGGYIHHDYFRTMTERLPSVVAKSMGIIVSALPSSLLNSFFNYPASLGKAGKNRICRLLRSYPDRLKSYLTFASVFTPDDKKNLYSSDFKHELTKKDTFLSNEMNFHFSQNNVGQFDSVMQWDLKTWFPNQTLMKLDRLSMAHGIEGRCPYADYRLIEFLLKIPYDIFKVFSANKRVIRQRYQKDADFLPKKKQAFYLPMHTIFNAKMNQLIEATLNRTTIRKYGLFEPSYVDWLLAQRAHSPLLADKQILCLLILLQWLEMQL